jgi:hypothetical protein
MPLVSRVARSATVLAIALLPDFKGLGRQFAFELQSKLVAN